MDDNADETVSIQLSLDQALVLNELFCRFGETDRLRLQNNAEFVALSAVSGQLQRTLAEPFQENYGELVAAARDRLAFGYEGLAPGVEPPAG